MKASLQNKQSRKIGLKIDHSSERPTDEYCNHGEIKMELSFDFCFHCMHLRRQVKCSVLPIIGRVSIKCIDLKIFLKACSTLLFMFLQYLGNGCMDFKSVSTKIL